MMKRELLTDDFEGRLPSYVPFTTSKEFVTSTLKYPVHFERTSVVTCK